MKRLGFLSTAISCFAPAAYFVYNRVRPVRAPASNLEHSASFEALVGRRLPGFFVHQARQYLEIYRLCSQPSDQTVNWSVEEGATGGSVSDTGNLTLMPTATSRLSEPYDTGMGIYYADLAVDSAGTIYVGARYQVGSYDFVPSVFEFPPMLRVQ